MTKAVTQLCSGAKTTVGLKRDLNQDDFAAVEQFKDWHAWPIAEKKGNLYVVADGMGGHNAGGVASRLAVDIVAEEYYEDGSADACEELVRLANEAGGPDNITAMVIRVESAVSVRRQIRRYHLRQALKLLQ